MIKIIKIIIIAVIVFFADNTCFSQSVTIPSDTAKVSQNDKKSQTQETTKQGQNQQGKTGENTGNQAVKQVKSARPDMTKAKGARPSNIVRPSGSSIPKGVGKPGGARRMGGR